MGGTAVTPSSWRPTLRSMPRCDEQPTGELEGGGGYWMHEQAVRKYLTLFYVPHSGNLNKNNLKEIHELALRTTNIVTCLEISLMI